MLLRAPVQALKSKQVGKHSAHIAIAMRHYPRYVAKDLAHEYLRVLAPDEALFDEFKARERDIQDHNQAFADVNYEARFTLSEAGMTELARLTTIAKSKDVYLICQCTHDQRCHTDLLLITARVKLGALTSPTPFDYPVYLSRQ